MGGKINSGSWNVAVLIPRMYRISFATANIQATDLSSVLKIECAFEHSLCLLKQLVDHINRYIICPEEMVVDIWHEYKLNLLRERKEYDADDLAFALKAAVTNWACNNIRTPVSIFRQIHMRLIHIFR